MSELYILHKCLKIHSVNIFKKKHINSQLKLLEAGMILAFIGLNNMGNLDVRTH